jgi:hypothetical protein
MLAGGEHRYRPFSAERAADRGLGLPEAFEALFELDDPAQAVPDALDDHAFGGELLGSLAFDRLDLEQERLERGRVLALDRGVEREIQLVEPGECKSALLRRPGLADEVLLEQDPLDVDDRLDGRIACDRLRGGAAAARARPPRRAWNQPSPFPSGCPSCAPPAEPFRGCRPLRPATSSIHRPSSDASPIWCGARRPASRDGLSVRDVRGR